MSKWQFAQLQDSSACLFKLCPAEQSRRIISYHDVPSSGLGACYRDARLRWDGRVMVLSLLTSYLHRSIDVQRRAVQSWHTVTALFGLLWEEKTRSLALCMVRLLSLILLWLALPMSLPGEALGSSAFGQKLLPFYGISICVPRLSRCTGSFSGSVFPFIAEITATIHM